MLARAIAIVAALLLACLGSEVGAYARADRLATYDAANNLIREETPNGAQIDSSYDELNRRVSRLLQGAAAPGAWSGSRFSFDANGKVLTESTEVAGLPAWTRTRQYDRQERLIFERDGDGATLATTYDPQNNRLTLTDSAGDLTRYTYDHANRLTSVAAPAIGTTEYHYNTASQLIERTGQGGYSSVTAYDPAGRVQRIEHRIGGTPTLTLEYDYDRNGNRAEQRLTHAGSGLERTSYAYDNADRLTRSTRTPPTGNALETTWTLDAVGNRTLEEVRELGSLTQRTAYSYDLRDRLQTATPELPTGPPTAYQYDADGNVSSEQIGSAAPTQYRWDARDRLREYTPAGAPAIRNRYDESDRRIAREDAATGSRYRWDGNAVIEETNALGNRLTRYHRGIGLIGATSATTQPDPRQYASDAQDTPLALIRPDGGIAGRASFDIWGKSTSQSGEQSKLGFTGYQKETGDLYQAVARYYRPGTGSFLSTDPWEGDYNNPVSLNKYLYGYGNPGIFVDPDGRCVEPVSAAFCALGLATVATAVTEYVRLTYFGNEDERANAASYAASNTATAVAMVGGALAVAETGGAAAPLAMGLMQGGRAGFNYALVNTAPRAYAAAETVALVGAGAAGAEVPSVLPGVPGARQVLSESAAELDARLLRMEPRLAGFADEVPAASMAAARTLIESHNGAIRFKSSNTNGDAGIGNLENGIAERTPPTIYVDSRGNAIVASPTLKTNHLGASVVIPEGHQLSARDPALVDPPHFEAGPFTSANRDGFLAGNSGGTRLAPHHRHQIPTSYGGVIDELRGPGHPLGNEHTTGSPTRHPNPSIFNRSDGGSSLRGVEIDANWRSKGARLIEVAPGVWIDPGG